MSTPERLRQLDAIHAQLRDLFTKKNEAYGDSFNTYGPIGVILRIGDKVARFVTLTGKHQLHLNPEVDGESLRDTLRDLANYCAMTLMLLDEGAAQEGPHKV